MPGSASDKKVRRGARPAARERAARPRAVGLEALFDVLLAECVVAEGATVRFLRPLGQRAVSARLRDAISYALADSEYHHRRFGVLQRQRSPRARGRRSAGIVEGILRTARADLRKIGRSEIGDVLLTTVLQKLAHYAIAVIGSLAAWADAMADERAARVFATALRDKKLADKYLTEIASGLVMYSLFDMRPQPRAGGDDGAAPDAAERHGPHG